VAGGEKADGGTINRRSKDWPDPYEWRTENFLAKLGGSGGGDSLRQKKEET